MLLEGLEKNPNSQNPSGAWESGAAQALSPDHLAQPSCHLRLAAELLSGLSLFQQIKKDLKKYSKIFEQKDRLSQSKASKVSRLPAWHRMTVMGGWARGTPAWHRCPAWHQCPAWHRCPNHAYCG
jgi:hypothetical protein